LNIACGLNSFTNYIARFAQAISNQLFIIHARHLNVDVNTIQQWTGDVVLIFGKDSGRARTGFFVGNQNIHNMGKDLSPR